MKFLAVFACLFLFACLGQRESFSVSDSGIMHFPEKSCAAQEINGAVDGEDRVVALRFENEGAWVYGLLRVPEKAAGGRVPGLVLIHGAGVDKEFEQTLARFLSSKGYASLAIDLRGSGETRGGRETAEEALANFASGKPAEVQLMVSDALCAFSILKSRSEVDPVKVAFAGESMGGRIAVIAAALEPEARGVVGISTSGYGLPADKNSTVQRFLRSIDPENYAPLVSPRRFVLVHSTNDQIVPYSAVIGLYERALEPRRLVAVSCSTHGYCSEMDQAIEVELGKMFS